MTTGKYRKRSRSAKRVTKKHGGAQARNRGGGRKKGPLDPTPNDNNKDANNKDANNKLEKNEEGEPNSKSNNDVAIVPNNKAKAANNQKNESELDPDDVAVQQQSPQDQ